MRPPGPTARFTWGFFGKRWVMSMSSLVPERPEDLDRIADLKDVFVFAPRAAVRPVIDDERACAVGRLLGFVGLAGVGAGVALWLAGQIVVEVVRGLFS